MLYTLTPTLIRLGVAPNQMVVANKIKTEKVVKLTSSLLRPLRFNWYKGTMMMMVIIVVILKAKRRKNVVQKGLTDLN